MIGGMMKYYRIGFRELLYDISYNNLVLLSAAIPDYGRSDEKKEVTIKGDDPANNELLKKFLS